MTFSAPNKPSPFFVLTGQWMR
uniref:Uncharacterized protein n=1 Tax=Arundo donax TaxID=35708 RepID=A0A0A8ZET3_ARUDO